jgi:hypothetical protein
VKIYIAAVEALRKKEIQDEAQFTTKIDCFLSLTPPLPTLNADYTFLQVFLKSHLVYDQTQGSGCVFLTLQITLIDQTLFVTALFKVTYMSM